MHTGVNLGVQRMSSNIDSNLTYQEVDYYLNESVDEYIKQQYLVHKQDARSKQSDLVLENLRTLIKTVEIESYDPNLQDYNFLVSTSVKNAFSFDLPSDYLFYLESKTEISDVVRNNILLSHSSAKKLLETKHNKPLFREYPIIIEGTKANVVLPLSDWSLVYTGGQITTQNFSVKLSYISKPDDISYDNNVEFSLPEQTHKEIVNITVIKIINILNQGIRQ